MRITSEMMVTNSMRRLSQRLEHYESAQSALASGKRLRKPSDDPSGASRALGLRAAQRAREQEARNGADAKAWLDIGDAQLQGALERLHRARDLTVRAATDGDATDRKAIAREIESVREELIGIANFRNRGRPLFAGFSQGDAVRQDAAGVVTFTGDSNAVRRRVGDQDEVTINVTADVAFGFTDPNDGTADVFAVLKTIIDELSAGTNTNMSARIADLDVAGRRIGDSLATLGAAANRVESAGLRGDANLLAIRGELAEVEDVDVAAAVLELQTQEIAYQATLQALGRSLPQSLISFLR